MQYWLSNNMYYYIKNTWVVSSLCAGISKTLIWFHYLLQYQKVCFMILSTVGGGINANHLYGFVTHMIELLIWFPF